MRAEGFVSLRCEGRGGFVSRRDHNQVYRRTPLLLGGTTYAEANPPNASRSSGGSAREGLLSEKPPPSHTPHVPYSQKRPLPQNLPI